MEFIIAVVLWVVIGLIVGPEKMAANRVKKENDAFNDSVSSWKAQVVDAKLERQFMYGRDSSYDKEIEEIKREIDPDDPTLNSGAIGDGALLLAKRGKLSNWDAYHGFSVDYNLKAAKGVGLEKQIRDQHKIVLWIDKQLRKHGVYERMYFYPHDMKYCFPACEAKDTETGTYRWRPTIPYGDIASSREDAYQKLDNYLEECRKNRESRK